MAIQLFKPFVINEIVNKEIASNPKTAEKLIDRQDPRIWDIVESVIDGYPVLMNRAPTLHRLGIQAFKPKLVEGRAMRLHPLAVSYTHLGKHQTGRSRRNQEETDGRWCFCRNQVIHTYTFYKQQKAERLFVT